MGLVQGVGGGDCNHPGFHNVGIAWPAAGCQFPALESAVREIAWSINVVFTKNRRETEKRLKFVADFIV